MIDNIEELKRSIQNLDFRFDIDGFKAIVHKVKVTITMLDDSELMALLILLQTLNLDENALRESARKCLSVLEEIRVALENEIEATTQFPDQQSKAA
jgi:hypothetical protein